MLRRCLVSGVCFSFFLVFACAGARAQRSPDIFVTPVPNAPFYGMVEVQRSLVQKNGTAINLKTTRLMARDSVGRIYTESRQLVPASSTVAPVILRANIYDPQTRVSTLLLPRGKLYRSRVINRPPSSEPPGQLDASAAGANLPTSQFTKQEDLGAREMSGLQVHGVREMQTIPASGGGEPVVVMDEYWYSDYLHINLMLKHSDPRTGSVTMTLTQVSQQEPDPSLFKVPDGYKPLSMMAAKRSK
jgi:hypothetical protein